VDTPSAERLVVGLVRGLHGLRGTLRIEILTDHAGRFGRGSVLYPEGTDQPLTVTWSQADGPGLLLRFRECPTRVEAEALRGTYLEAATVAAALPPDTWYWHQIMGSSVQTVSGEALGTVTDIFRTGGSEVYVVTGGPRGELLVPAVGAVVRELAPDAGRIVVDADALGLPEAIPVKKLRGRLTTRGRQRDAGPEVAPGPAPEGPAEAPFS
jgi:16S rRNA processing protein RimM